MKIEKRGKLKIKIGIEVDLDVFEAAGWQPRHITRTLNQIPGVSVVEMFQENGQ